MCIVKLKFMMDLLDQKENKNNFDDKSFKVKQSFNFFLVSLAGVQVVIIIAVIAVVFLISLMSSSLENSFNWLGSFIITGLIIFDIFIVFRGFLNWKFTTYLIKPEELMIRTGILEKKEKLFTLNQIETVTVRQGVFGRMFDYGSLRIFSPLLNGKVDILNIPEPRKFEKLLLTPPKGEAKDKTTLIPDVTAENI